ncbi:MAG: O-antigen ligase family protein, partial [Pseudomonadota bacterium]
LFLSGVILMVQAVTYQHIIQGFFSSITGNGIDYQSSPRMGLMRAQGSFAHPIQAGVFLASFLSLYWLAGFKFWVKISGALAAMLSFATVSSVTLLALAFGIALLVYHWLTELVVNITWRLLFIFSGLFIFAAEIGTSSGTFGLLMRFGSLNAVSAYARINIWKYGSENVAQNPWFGLGYADWDRPIWMVDSVDNYWLLTAMRFGIPAVFFLGLAAFLAIMMLMRRTMTSSYVEARFERGVAIATGIFTLSIVSASIWLQPQVWYFMLLGIAVSLATAARPIPRGSIRAPLPDPDTLNLQHPLESAHPRPS